jgi:hypothetical protein
MVQLFLFFNACTGLFRSTGFEEVEAPRCKDSRHMNMVILSALQTGCSYTPRNISGTLFCYMLSRPLWIKSMKNSNDSIGNRTLDLPAQPTGPPGAPWFV